MRRVRPRPTFQQLCVIAREQITAAPTIDDFAWKELVKRRLVQLGFDYPREPQQLTEAMAAIERALTKQWGPRPAPLPVALPTVERTHEVIDQVDPPWPTRTARPQGWTSVQHLATQKRRAGGLPDLPEASMPVTKAPTLRGVERQKALRILAQGILDQVQRCEDAEAVAARAARDEEPPS